MPSATRRRHKSRTRHCATFALAMMLSLAFGLTGCKGAEAASKAKVQANPRHTPLVDVYEANKRSVVSIVILIFELPSSRRKFRARDEVPQRRSNLRWSPVSEAARARSAWRYGAISLRLP